MTLQREHADKIAAALASKGLEVQGVSGERLCSVRVGGLSFDIPPFAAYNHDASETADDIAKRIAA